jgi:hypothetical protein
MIASPCKNGWLPRASRRVKSTSTNTEQLLAQWEANYDPNLRIAWDDLCPPALLPTRQRID